MLLNSKALEHRRRRRPARRIGVASGTAALLVPLLALALGAGTTGARAQGPVSAAAYSASASGNSTILDARDALRKRDRSRLAATRAASIADQHPLAMWADYWELSSRLGTASQEELEAFYARWSGTYVEDRLRNDWLLELGRRRDWRNFAADHPRFRMNDDREVSCYALLIDQQAGKDVTDAGRATWLTQKDADDGCNLLAQALYGAGRIGQADAWHKARLSLDAGKTKATRQAAELIGPDAAQAVDELLDNPARYLARRAGSGSRIAAELSALALLRTAANDPDAARRLLDDRWDRALPADLAAWVWASAGRAAAQRLAPDAPDYYQRAEQRLATGSSRAAKADKGDKTDLPPPDTDWADETLAWKVRGALRASAGVGDGITQGAGRWLQVRQAIDAMSETEQREPGWIYWKARALQALAGGGAEGDAQREQALQLLRTIAGQMHFYGKLAAEDLGQAVPVPPRPAPLSPAEREAAAANAGLSRALLLIAIGLRGEGVREWNFSLRGMGDRELLAAAQRACDREVWDRCINTSDRTRDEIDMAQRFPTPFRDQVLARTREIGLDPAYVYGLIRQESRFVMDVRSNVGATGLMQLMPATARWTAKKAGLPYSADMLTDRDLNIKLGTSYLKLVLDDFNGSQALAAAAYNAGPGRPRKWREGPVLEVAAWAENIPFNETRDYVKKVLSNATYYGAVLSNVMPSLKNRLGRLVGPRDANAAPPNTDLP